MTKFARILTVFTVSFVFAAAKLPMTESELEKAAEGKFIIDLCPYLSIKFEDHNTAF